MMRRRQVVALLVVSALGALTCREGTGPQPVTGTLDVKLLVDFQHDGALSIRVTTESPRTVRYGSTRYGGTIYHRQITDQDLRVIVVGGIGPWTIATLIVSDITNPEAYHATVVDVSGWDGQLVPLDRYRVSLITPTSP